MITAHKLSDPDQKQWQSERRCQKQEIKRRMQQGAHLVTLRDKGEKHYDDMSAKEQQDIHDLECNKLQNEYENIRIKNQYITLDD